MCSVEGQGIYIQMLGGGHYGEWVSIPPPAILHRYAECCQARWSPPSTPGTSTSSTRKPIMCPPASSHLAILADLKSLTFSPST